MAVEQAAKALMLCWWPECDGPLGCWMVQKVESRCYWSEEEDDKKWQTANLRLSQLPSSNGNAGRAYAAFSGPGQAGSKSLNGFLAWLCGFLALAWRNLRQFRLPAWLRQVRVRLAGRFQSGKGEAGETGLGGRE